MKYYVQTYRGETSYFYETNGLRVSFTENPDNTDYQVYLKWLEEGNTPEPADEHE